MFLGVKFETLKQEIRNRSYVEKPLHDHSESGTIYIYIYKIKQNNFKMYQKVFFFFFNNLIIRECGFELW